MLRKLINRWRRRRFLRAVRILVNSRVQDDIHFVVENDDRVLTVELMQTEPVDMAN